MSEERSDEPACRQAGLRFSSSRVIDAQEFFQSDCFLSPLSFAGGLKFQVQHREGDETFRSVMPSLAPYGVCRS